MTPTLEKKRSGTALKLCSALLLNAAFLALALLIMPPAFEANDDLTLAAFADGQMAVKCSYIPYINYVLALLLNGVYRLFGEGVAWHTVGQYTLLFLSFTAVSYVLCERLRFWQATAVSLVLLLFFGVDSYMIISYTKTAGICAVGGMALLFLAAEDKRRLPAIAGTLLCLFGFMLRMMEFLPCMAIVAVLGLRWLYKLLFIEKKKGKLKDFLHYLAPFAVMLALCAGLFAVDKAAWSKSPYAEFKRFDAVRVAYSDYGRPDYSEMPEAYDALGLSEASVQLLGEGNYFDPEAFNADVMQSISDAREENIPAPSLGECLGKLLDTCLMGFFGELHVYGFLLILALWLCSGNHSLRDWLTLAGVCGMFALFYLYLIYRGRYLVDRVDVGLFFAMSAAAAWMLSEEKMQREKFLSAALLCLAVFTSFWLNRGSFRNVEREDRSSEISAVETILSDSEHIYLAKLDTVNDTLYPPFTPAPAGYWDRIILLGGWDCGHPAIMSTLAEYGVENPYRDIVGNERVYIIDDNIELTLAHIREFYSPDAAAELIEPLSAETGLTIYRISERGGDAA